MLKQHARLVQSGLRLADLVTLSAALWVGVVAAQLGRGPIHLPGLEASFPLLATEVDLAL